MHDFDDVETARAWRQHLEEAGMEAVITADWQPDRFGRGDIALRVPPGRWSEAEEFLGLDLDWTSPSRTRVLELAAGRLGPRSPT